jgi:hypothetical protein
MDGVEIINLKSELLDVFVSSSNPNERVADVYHHQVALDICQVVAGNQSGLLFIRTTRQFPTHPSG